MANYQRFVQGVSPVWASGGDKPGTGYWGGRLLKTLWGITADTISIALSQAISAPMLHIGGKQPVDALPLLGWERNMPRYPVETHQQYRTRLHGAWDAWGFAGNESAIIAQFEAAGFDGIELKEPLRTHSDTLEVHGDWERAPLGYWSHFWLFLPEGTHSYPSGTHTFGGLGLSFGGGALFGSLLTVEDVALLRGIANKWRPAHVICREIVIEFSGPSYGTGHVFGEAGLVYSDTENELVAGL